MSGRDSINIALDTGCLNARGKHPVLNKLDELEKQELVTLSTSTTSQREQIQTQKSSKWLKRYLSRIKTLKVKMEPAMIGVTLVDGMRIAPDDTDKIIDEISQICFPGARARARANKNTYRELPAEIIGDNEKKE